MLKISLRNLCIFGAKHFFSKLFLFAWFFLHKFILGKKNFGRNFFCQNFFAKNFFDQKFSLAEFFFAKNCFCQKSFLGRNFFQNFFCQNFFGCWNFQLIIHGMTFNISHFYHFFPLIFFIFVFYWDLGSITRRWKTRYFEQSFPTKRAKNLGFNDWGGFYSGFNIKNVSGLSPFHSIIHSLTYSLTPADSEDNYPLWQAQRG